MAKRTNDPTSQEVDSSDAEVTGISSQVRVDTDPRIDPDVKLISQEQLERSAYVEKIGHAARHMELDERDPSDKLATVPGVGFTEMNGNGKAS